MRHQSREEVWTTTSNHPTRGRHTHIHISTYSYLKHALVWNDWLTTTTTGFLPFLYHFHLFCCLQHILLLRCRRLRLFVRSLWKNVTQEKVAPQIRRSRGGRNTQKQKLRPKQQFPIYESCARSIVHTHTDDDGGDGDSHKHKLLGEGKEGEEEAEEVDGVPTPTLLLALSFPLIGDWLRYTWASLGVWGGGMGINLSESLSSLSPLDTLSHSFSLDTLISLSHSLFGGISCLAFAKSDRQGWL